MNLPNKLTVLRIILVPFFILFLLLPNIPHNNLWALIIFAIASITDMLDGKIARKYNLITNFGKFLDPLADKMLVVSALICFIELNFVSSIAVVIIVAREFLVTSLRLIAAGEGTVIAAGSLGKIKTVVQMVAIIMIMISAEIEYIGVSLPINPMMISNIVMWVAVALTILSGAVYLYQNRNAISPNK
ncbi:MAG: CDP-diacylglycerol--glycerol-3-phosphate 3-phosphatidyltransferase [Oscillospiraceae bacterium]|nr:CDP-diacylglycerol--glycerol-3-phosphate 3-phosphatidyltransferase [Oscillospiraceae bacterium]